MSRVQVTIRIPESAADRVQDLRKQIYSDERMVLARENATNTYSYLVLRGIETVEKESGQPVFSIPVPVPPELR